MRGVTAACLCLLAIFAVAAADVDSHHLSKRQIYRHHTSQIKNTGPGERLPAKVIQANSDELPAPVAPARRRPAGRPKGTIRPRPAPAPLAYEESVFPAPAVQYYEEPYQQPIAQQPYQQPYQEPYQPQEGTSKSILINTQPARQSSGYKPKPAYEEYDNKPVRQGYSQEDGGYSTGNEIPGEAGKDYPIYHSAPYTKFDCSSVPTRPGMYADVETGCQVYRTCEDGRHGPAGAAFLCTNGTIFNQAEFTCDWWYNVDCRQAPEYYKLNADPAHNPFFKNEYEKSLKDGYGQQQRRQPASSAYDANADYYQQ